jgi:hypothetical protein
MPSTALSSARRQTRADPALAVILQRCAARDPACLRELETAIGMQVRTVLTRALGNADVAAFAVPAILSDLCDRAATFDPERELAEDWIFAQVRARLRELTQAAGQRTASPPAAAMRVPGARHALTARGPAGAIGATPAAAPVSRAPPLRRRWRPGRRRILPALAATLVGIALALLVDHARRLDGTEPAPVASIEPAAPQTSAPAPTPLAPPRQRASPSRPQPAEPLLPPLALPPAPDLTALPTPLPAAPPPPARAAPAEVASPPAIAVPAAAPPLPPAAKPLPGNAARQLEPGGPSPVRVFIHHAAGSGPGAAAAQSFAEDLRRAGFTVAGIRPVPFAIRAGSVRYYFDHDRAAARALAADYGGAEGRPLPPQDFSHYEPKPSPGTVEVWIASR